MYKVIIKHNNGEPLIFKTQTDVLRDKLAILPWVTFEAFPTIINKSDWAKSQQTIADYLELHGENVIKYIALFRIDGRTKEAKELKWFSWPKVFELVQAHQLRQKVVAATN